METDSPDVVRAERLLDELKGRGFRFRRIAPGPDGPLLGNRESGEWVDFIHIAGFSRDCAAWRKRKSALVVVGRELVDRRVEGCALVVLAEALTWQTEPS